MRSPCRRKLASACMGLLQKSQAPGVHHTLMLILGIESIAGVQITHANAPDQKVRAEEEALLSYVEAL